MKRVTASLKTKVLLLSILPLVLVTVAITMISLTQGWPGPALALPMTEV